MTESKESEAEHMMISFDDAIELFKELGQYAKAEDPGKYDCAINRLNYENEKAQGVEVKKIRKIRERANENCNFGRHLQSGT